MAGSCRNCHRTRHDRGEIEVRRGDRLGQGRSGVGTVGSAIGDGPDVALLWNAKTFHDAGVDGGRRAVGKPLLQGVPKGVGRRIRANEDALGELLARLERDACVGCALLWGGPSASREATVEASVPLTGCGGELLEARGEGGGRKVGDRSVDAAVGNVSDDGEALNESFDEGDVEVSKGIDVSGDARRIDG